MRMCSTIKTKAILFQQYLLCLVLWQNIAPKIIERYVELT